MGIKLGKIEIEGKKYDIFELSGENLDNMDVLEDSRSLLYIDDEILSIEKRILVTELKELNNTVDIIDKEENSTKEDYEEKIKTLKAITETLEKIKELNKKEFELKNKFNELFIDMANVIIKASDIKLDNIGVSTAREIYFKYIAVRNAVYDLYSNSENSENSEESKKK